MVNDLILTGMGNPFCCFLIKYMVSDHNSRLAGTGPSEEQGSVHIVRAVDGLLGRLQTACADSVGQPSLQRTAGSRCELTALVNNTVDASSAVAAS